MHCVGSDKSGRLTVALGPLWVELGVSRARPEGRSMPSFYPLSTSLSLSLSPPDRSSERCLALTFFLKHTTEQALGLGL